MIWTAGRDHHFSKLSKRVKLPHPGIYFLGKLFTASIGSVGLLYPSIFIYCVNLHQFLILCSSKAMVLVKLYFLIFDIYLISLVSLDPSGFHLPTK